MSSHWSDYWQGNAYDSFGEIKTDQSIEVVNSKWINFLSEFKTKQNILDIGTGGGTLIRLGLKHQKCKHSYVGIDYARLNFPEHISLNKDVTIIENENIESLTLETNSIDVALSQFAIEYSDWERSLAEIKRILRQNGRFQFICHHKKSEIIRRNSLILKVLERTLEDNGIVRTVSDLILALRTTPNKIQLLDRMRIKLKSELKQLHHSFSDEINDINLPQFVQMVFSHEHTSNREKITESYRQELVSYRLRLKALIAAALDQDSLSKLKEQFKHAKLELNTTELIYQDKLLLAIVLVGENSIS